MRLFVSTALMVCVSITALAHHPDKENQRVHRRIDVIPPLGTKLPMSHRRKYNRPSNWKGKIAYYIAPSSQEAMAWHNATHRGYYENDRPRIVTHYFYPKPWEALKIGPRLQTTGDAEQAIPAVTDVDADTEIMEIAPPPAIGETEAEIEAGIDANGAPSPSDLTPLQDAIPTEEPLDLPSPIEAPRSE